MLSLNPGAIFSLKLKGVYEALPYILFSKSPHFLFTPTFPGAGSSKILKKSLGGPHYHLQ